MRLETVMGTATSSPKDTSDGFATCGEFDGSAGELLATLGDIPRIEAPCFLVDLALKCLCRQYRVARWEDDQRAGFGVGNTWPRAINRTVRGWSPHWIMPFALISQCLQFGNSLGSGALGESMHTTNIPTNEQCPIRIIMNGNNSKSRELLGCKI